LLIGHNLKRMIEKTSNFLTYNVNIGNIQANFWGFINFWGKYRTLQRRDSVDIVGVPNFLEASLVSYL